MFWRKHPIRDEDLSAYVDRALPSSKRERVEAHLRACSACRETVDDYQTLRGALGALERARAPRSFALRSADVEAGPAAAAGPGRLAPALAGVTMVAFLTFGALLGVDLGGDGVSEEADDSVQGFVVPNAEEFAPAEGDAGSSEVTPHQALPDAGEEREAAGDADGEVAPQPEATEPPERTASEEDAPAGEDGGYPIGLRAGETAAAVLALAGAAGLVLVWRRRA